MLRLVLLASVLAALAACQSLPADGPSSRRVADQSAVQGYALVELDYASAERLRAAPARFLGSLTDAETSAPVDLIGVGDTLTIAIFEPSGALFGSRGPGGVSQSGAQTLPPVIVDRNGAVGVPFAGNVRVAGLTSGQAADAIRRALTGRVGQPQVVVSIAANPSNSVVVLGEVRRPGRANLTVNGDRVLDVIVEAGGAARPVEDLELIIQRDGRSWRAPFSAVTTSFGENVRLRRGDQLNLAYRARRYSVFGAVGSVAQRDLPPGPLTLAGALGAAGGLAPEAANARSVLVFRFERPEAAAALGLAQPPTARGVPVIYRLNLSEPAGVFTAQTFEVQPDDVLYVPRADAAELRKFFEFVQSLTRVIYDVSVTSALGD